MSSRFTILVWMFTALFALSLAQTSGVSAQDDDARRHFRLGQAHYDNGDFTSAATEFEEAYRLSQRPALLFNLYVAYRDANDLPHAASALERYLTQVPDAPEHDNLAARLRAMQETLRRQGGGAGATTTGTGTSATTGTGAGTSTTTGTGTSTGTGTGTSGITVGTGTGDTGSGDTGSGDTGTGTGDTGTGDSPDGGRSSSGLWMPGIIIAGVGGALVITGVITGVIALGAQSDLESMCPNKVCSDPSLQDTLDSGQTMATVTDVLLISGLVIVGAGITTMFLLGGRSSTERASASSTPRAAVGCSAHGCAGSLTMSF